MKTVLALTCGVVLGSVGMLWVSEHAATAAAAAATRGMPQPIGPCQADIDGSGAVGLGDIAAIIQNWGQPCYPDNDGDGYNVTLDCDDNNPFVYPGANEQCNGIDDNCDLQIDEGFDLNSDFSNCGQCGYSCYRPHAVMACVAGECVFQFCDEGWADIDGNPENGCETELIDLDMDGWYSYQDCDDTDQDVYPGAPERCNTIDDNCDGQNDEGFDLNSDFSNCGMCGNSCERPHAVMACVAGECVLQFCDPGWADVDGNPSNGCETPMGGLEAGGRESGAAAIGAKKDSSGAR
ncbi:MAG TPA: putative metal-binding motif-containing protein [Phycisphaerales bacterium]|nr:putative metal-binding motif-containing protein [Phycisphaerales bacterium]